MNKEQWIVLHVGFENVGFCKKSDFPQILV